MAKLSFQLPTDFVESYAAIEPKWGYKSGPNSLGELTYFRTYSRLKPDGSNEQWYETVERVVNGAYSLQKEHCEHYHLPWSEAKATRSAMEMYDRIFTFKFTPPGRGLWMQGSDYLFERRNSACLFNCAFVSTEDLHTSDPSKPFRFLMDMSMLGVGVGFDTEGVGAPIFEPTEGGAQWVVADSREGWVEATGVLIDAYLRQDTPLYEFDYSEVRPAGAPIEGFGGVAEGPEPLILLHERIREQFEGRGGGYVCSRDIVDIMNYIGCCVVAGNVRRSAEIALGDYGDEQFINLKNYELNPERAAYGWASNNTVVVHDGDEVDYEDLVDRIVDNGEPGIFYIDAARNYGRTADVPDYKDPDVKGINPCAEIALESYELCNLVEVFPNHHDSYEDFQRTLKFAYLYSKSVTLMPTNWVETNAAMLRNRRIGTSLSGIVQYLENHGEARLKQWMNAGYDYIQDLDELYSRWLCVRNSIKTTTVKPSGTVSIVAGSTPGVHYPVADYMIRRIRISKRHPMVPKLIEAGYHVEPAVGSADTTVVVEVPIKGEGLPTERDVSVRAKADVATLLAQHWADNAVSVTVTFMPDEKQDLVRVLKENEGKWKTVSFLPLTEDEAPYPQMPVERITKEEYERRIDGIDRIDLHDFYGSVAEGERYCTTDHCEIQWEEELVKSEA